MKTALIGLGETIERSHLWHDKSTVQKGEIQLHIGVGGLVLYELELLGNIGVSKITKPRSTTVVQ